MVISVPNQKGGTQKQNAIPIKFSTQLPEYRFVGVQTGSHSDNILKEIGFNQESIQSLSKKGAFGKRTKANGGKEYEHSK